MKSVSAGAAKNTFVPPLLSLASLSLSLSLKNKKQSTRQLGDVVEARVRGRVEDAEPAEESHALGLVGRLGRAAVLASAAAGGRVDECRCFCCAVLGEGAVAVRLASAGGGLFRVL